MDSPQLYLAKGNDIHIAYNPYNMELSVISPLIFKTINRLNNGKTFEDIVNIENLSQKEAILLRNKIKSLLTYNNNLNPPTEKKSNSIKRITVHISNDCNLRCKYCYADGGTYKQKRNFMTFETAKSFIEFCCSNFDNIKRIVFFGGEPMMNFPIMEYICKSFEEKYRNKECSFIPHFGIITNGTILNEKQLEFIKSNISFITVSIDGPQQINDTNRIFSNGSGSYKRIASFIHRIQKETNIEIKFEATFTQQHIDKGYTKKDISEILYKEFKIRGKVIEELSIQDNYNLQFWTNFDYKEWRKNEVLNIPEGFYTILETISKKRARKICNIGHDIFAVSTDGNIYPCHINNGELENCLGNLKNNIFNTPTLNQQFPAIKLRDNIECNSCWAFQFCGGCSRMIFYDFENKKYKSTPNKDLCDKFKKYTENILLLIASCRKDTITWEKIMKIKNIS